MTTPYRHTNESRALSIGTLKFIVDSLAKRNLLPLLKEPEAIVFGALEQAVVAGMSLVAGLAVKGEDVRHFIMSPEDGPIPPKEPPPSPVP